MRLLLFTPDPPKISDSSMRAPHMRTTDSLAHAHESPSLFGSVSRRGYKPGAGSLLISRAGAAEGAAELRPYSRRPTSARAPSEAVWAWQRCSGGEAKRGPSCRGRNLPRLRLYREFQPFTEPHFPCIYCIWTRLLLALMYRTLRSIKHVASYLYRYSYSYAYFIRSADAASDHR